MPTSARISAALARSSASDSRSRGSASSVSHSCERPRRCRPIMHVLEHADALEHAGALEGARQAQRGDLVRLQIVQRGAAIAHLALGRPQKAGDDVEGGGLAGAVRADQADDLALVDDEIHVGDRNQAAEMNRDMLDRQHAAASAAESARSSACPASWSRRARARLIACRRQTAEPFLDRRHDALRQHEHDQDHQQAVEDPLHLGRGERARDHRA